MHEAPAPIVVGRLEVLGSIPEKPLDPLQLLSGDPGLLYRAGDVLDLPLKDLVHEVVEFRHRGAEVDVVVPVIEAGLRELVDGGFDVLHADPGPEPEMDHVRCAAVLAPHGLLGAVARSIELPVPCAAEHHLRPGILELHVGCGGRQLDLLDQRSFLQELRGGFVCAVSELGSERQEFSSGMRAHRSHPR